MAPSMRAIVLVRKKPTHREVQDHAKERSAYINERRPKYKNESSYPKILSVVHQPVSTPLNMKVNLSFFNSQIKCHIFLCNSV